jgi:hypothetical protein
MSLELRCCFSGSGWSWHLRAWDTVEIYSHNQVAPAAVLTGAQLAGLVAHYLAQAGLVAQLLPPTTIAKAENDRKPLARALRGMGHRRLRGYGTT